jgi:hypothetical protein
MESRMGIYSPLESSRADTYHIIIRHEYLLSSIAHRLQNFRKTQESSLHLDPSQPSITPGAYHKIFSRLRLTFSFDRSEDPKFLVQGCVHGTQTRVGCVRFYHPPPPFSLSRMIRFRVGCLPPCVGAKVKSRNRKSKNLGKMGNATKPPSGATSGPPNSNQPEFPFAVPRQRNVDCRENCFPR